MPSHPLIVCLTADIEFEIRGALTYPDRCSPVGFESVVRDINGKSQGLAPLVDPLAELGLPATFFIETMQVAHFGTSPMAQVIKELSRHPLIDLQLHAHPCWEYMEDPNWRQIVQKIIKNDSMAGRGVDSAARILSRASDFFHQLTNRTPTVFRSGGLQVDQDLLLAQEKIGIHLSSSVGKAYFNPQAPNLSLWSGIARQNSVTEIPVTSYKVGIPGHSVGKILTVTGTPFSTMIRILEHSFQSETGPLVFLTHASEMAVDAGGIFESARYVPIHSNQERWTRLCRYLHENRDRFLVLPFGSAANFWANQSPVSHPPYRGGIKDFSALTLRRFIRKV